MTEKVEAAEATREPLSRVETVATSLVTEQETAIKAELVKYAELKDKIKVELSGKVRLSYRGLIEEIRQRIRKHFGWTLLPSELMGALSLSPYAGGISASDKQSASGDSDAVSGAFSRGLFEWE